MKHLILSLQIIFFACHSTTSDKASTTQKINATKNIEMVNKQSTDTGWVYTGIGTVYERKDAKGRIVERYGNTKKRDNYGNFREFYEYDQEGLFVKYIRYGIESEDCVIKNKDAFSYKLYFYDNHKKCIRKEEYWLFPDEKISTKYQHKLVRIFDFVAMEEKSSPNPMQNAPFISRKLSSNEYNFIPDPKKWRY